MSTDIIIIVLLVIVILTGGMLVILGFRDKLLSGIVPIIQKHKACNPKTYREAILDYNVYHMSIAQKVTSIVVAAVLLFCLGYVFYRNIFLSFLLTAFSLFYPRFRKVSLIEKRKHELKLQFKDALQALSSSLYAGKSLESAMRSSIKDLQIQYELDAYIIQEFEIIVRKLESNEPIENAFLDFADRSHIEEVKGFAEILEICKRSGGNLIMAIKSSSEIISDKIEVLNDIQGILASKKLEQKILMIMPVVIILMLSTSSKEFMEPVFTLPAGRIVMTVSMLLFGVAYFVSSKITNIEV